MTINPEYILILIEYNMMIHFRLTGIVPSTDPLLKSCRFKIIFLAVRGLFIMDISKITSKGMDVEVLVKITDRGF